MGNPAGVRRDFQKLEERRLLGRGCYAKEYIRPKWHDRWECIAVGQSLAEQLKQAAYGL